jgi:hypothetical protein
MEIMVLGNLLRLDHWPLTGTWSGLAATLPVPLLSRINFLRDLLIHGNGPRTRNWRSRGTAIEIMPWLPKQGFT